MTIHHRLRVDADIALPILESLGLSMPARSDESLLIEDISEEDPAWPRFALFLEEYHRVWVAHPRNAWIAGHYGSTCDSLADFVSAKFSDAERRAAPYLLMDASLIGYPEPQHDAVEFYRVTYKKDCPKCPAGLEQIVPLCLAREPKWGRRRGIFQLNYVCDEFLVKPEMFDKVFRPFGVTSRPLLAFKSRAPLQTVVQLEILLRGEIDVAGIPNKTCESCGVQTYTYDHSRNYAPMPLTAPGPIFKSRQIFHPFDLLVYVDQELFRAIQESGFRGAGFVPCAALRH